MIPTIIIAFREFLEAFLITGVFLGISKKLGLKKEAEIGIATAVGITISFLLSAVTYGFGDTARAVLTETRAEILGDYLRLFSGFFLIYVVFSLHARIGENKKMLIKKATNRLEKRVFDFSLFMTIVMLITREGFEIALFTASTSLFAEFAQNLIGLFIGFLFSAIAGGVAYIAYAKFPIRKVFRTTEYMVMLLGASMVQIGITGLLKSQFHIDLASFASFGLNFLPNDQTLIGHLLKSFVGVDKEFSLSRLVIMLTYIAGVYIIIGKKRNPKYEK